MAQKPIGVIVNGVSGRMGYRRRLVRSILAIRDQGRQWEQFIRQIVEGADHDSDLLAGVQPAQAGLESSRTGARVDLTERTRPEIQ